MRCVCLFLQFLIVLFAIQVHAMPGALTGSAELRYGQFTAEEAGRTVLEASHFVQKYSVLWNTAGDFNRGRLGEYDFSLGYEWAWIDSEINGSEVSIQNPLDKILFKGDVLLAPGGLPLRVHLYSYDLQSSNFSYQEFGELFSDQDFDPQPGIITSLTSGSHITTGMTLVAGVQNGNYRGNYRDLLTALPKLFIDFRQDEVRDLAGTDPREYVDRNLAFVSLNKNKNWFHYRFFTHEDKVQPLNDFQSQTFLLGTIDHVNRRQWVDLTNWIQVSTDLSYSETTPNPGAREDAQKRYDYNLFATARRADWRGGGYANFSRVRDAHSLQKSVDVPILASGRLDRETSWRFRIENQHDEDSLIAGGLKSKNSTVFMSSRLDMFSQSHYMVSPLLDVEYKDGTRSDGRALRAGVEVYNNQRYRTDADLFGSYTVSVFDGTSADGVASSYWEQQLVGRYAKDLDSDLRTGFEQELALGSGNYDAWTADFIQADIAALSSEGAGEGDSDGDYYRSITRWFVDHRPASRIYNRFEVNYDYAKSSIDSGGQLSLVHNLNYYGRTLKGSIDSELIFGSSLHDSVGQVSGAAIDNQGGTVARSFESRGRLGYDPGRRHHNNLDMELEWREFDSGGSDQRYRITQLYEYTFWKDSGLLRKVAMLGQELEYENYAPSVGRTRSLLSFTLFSELYPTRQTLLSARLRYEVDASTEADAALIFLSASVDFEKFQMQFDYAYGTRTAGLNQPERVEHKWEMQVKKTF